jgi:hypothetical protein
MSHDTTTGIERIGSGLPGCDGRRDVLVLGNGHLEKGLDDVHAGVRRPARQINHLDLERAVGSLNSLIDAWDDLPERRSYDDLIQVCDLIESVRNSFAEHLP